MKKHEEEYFHIRKSILKNSLGVLTILFISIYVLASAFKGIFVLDRLYLDTAWWNIGFVMSIIIGIIAVPVGLHWLIWGQNKK